MSKDLVNYDSGKLDSPAGVGFKPNKKQKVWLEAISETGEIRAAERATGINHAYHYRWLKNSPGYKAAFEEAWDRAGDLMVDEAYRRAVNGVKRPLSYKGRLTGDFITEKSDVLLMFLIKARRPEHRDSFPLNQFSTGPVQFNVTIQGDKPLRFDGEKLDRPKPRDEQEKN